MKTQSPKKVVLLVGRDDWHKDTHLNHILRNYLKKNNYQIMWEHPAGSFIYKLQSIESHLKWLPKPVKALNLKLVKLLYMLTHWSYVVYLYNRPNEFIEFRCPRLKKRIQNLSANNELIVFSRSSGGRAISLIADELNIKHIVCLGYPFQNPNNGVEPERYLHLANLQTPMLIIQGINDEYGGIEIKEKYHLSPQVNLFFVDTDHNFNIDDSTWNVLYAKIDEVIK